jgi:hypothetical protein
MTLITASSDFANSRIQSPRLMKTESLLSMHAKMSFTTSTTAAFVTCDFNIHS